MYAVKANRIYRINEDEKQKYINMGYKIAELKGSELAFEEIETEEAKELAKLKKENEKLRKEIEKLQIEAKKGEGK
mgnify:FL=1